MRIKILLASLLACAPLSLQAQPERAPATLIDAWLEWQSQHSAPFDWAYSFALRETDAARLERRRQRLIAELASLSIRARVERRDALLPALAAWREALAATPAQPARSPEPLGLPQLITDLRTNPAMATIASLGTCQAPAWVELWTLAGVTKRPWTPGMTAAQALNGLSPQALRGIDEVTLITPQGAQHRLGVAAWNPQDAPLAPGARLVVQLPVTDGVYGLINRELPAYLATRLPGDDCQSRMMQ